MYKQCFNNKSSSWLWENKPCITKTICIAFCLTIKGHMGHQINIPYCHHICFYLSDQFQFVSQRHRGYPFSVTLYVDGIMAARISSCCEYRYAPGFQQGRKSCFRLSWLTGGIPCHRSDFILSQMDGTSLVETGKLVSSRCRLGQTMVFNHMKAYRVAWRADVLVLVHRRKYASL